MIDSDTETVSFTVVRCDRFKSGRVAATADVVAWWSGCEVAIFNIEVRRVPPDRLMVAMPHTRNHEGHWVPAVALDQELERAVCREVAACAGFTLEPRQPDAGS